MKGVFLFESTKTSTSSKILKKLKKKEKQNDIFMNMHLLNTNNRRVEIKDSKKRGINKSKLA